MILLFRREHRALKAAADGIPRELRYNAGAIRTYDSGGSMHDLQHALVINEWKAGARTLHVLSKKDPRFWNELADAYVQLRSTKNHGAQPPGWEHILSLYRNA
jgi:hypothetical protein